MVSGCGWWELLFVIASGGFFFFFFLFFFPAVDCGDGWMWLVGLLFMVVSGDFFFFFFPCYDLWWWVDVASGDNGGFLLVVA